MLRQWLRYIYIWHAPSRDAILEEVRKLPPDELLQLAQMEPTTYRKRRRKVHTTALSGTGTWLCATLYATYSLTLPPDVFLCGSALAAALLGNYFHRLTYLSDTHRGFLRLLADKGEDMRFLGIALDHYSREEPGSSAKESLAVLLKRLLPRLQPGQTEILTPERMRALLGMLASPYEDPDLTLCVLNALAKVGEEEAVPIVQPLAEGVVKQLTGDLSPTDEMLHIQRAAAECIPCLYENTLRNVQSQTLLRASAVVTHSDSDTLLRPVSTTTDNTPQEELLRPVSR